MESAVARTITFVVGLTALVLSAFIGGDQGADGRTGAVLLAQSNGHQSAVASYAQSVPALADAAPDSAATPDATPSATLHISANYPDGAAVRSNRDPVVFRSIPRTIGEHIGRLTGLRVLIVTGPVTDSGDGIWVGVTDQESGLFGYLSIADLVPPEPRPSNSSLFEQSLISTAPILLRGMPELSASADATLEVGTALVITGETIQNGLVWLSVDADSVGGEQWVLPDTLSIGRSDPEQAASTTTALTFPLDATVTVGAEGQTTILRALPRTVAEPIARLPGTRQMQVAGPLTDSTDNLWLPVIDSDTAVFGYVALGLVTPPDSSGSAAIQIGTTFHIADDIHLRALPDATTATSSSVASGSDVDVTATKLSSDIPWVQISVASTNVSGWIPADILWAATDA